MWHQVVQERTIEFDPFAGTVPMAAAPARTVDETKFPGIEFFSREVALYAIDGFQPNDKTTAAAGKLQKLMKTADAADKAIAQLDEAVPTSSAASSFVCPDQCSALTLSATFLTSLSFVFGRLLGSLKPSEPSAASFSRYCHRMILCQRWSERPSEMR